MTTAEVADSLDVSRRTAYGRLDRMVERGHLASKKVGSRGRVWWPTGAAIGRPGTDAAGGEATDSERMLSRLIDNLPGMVYRCRNEPGWPMTYVSDGCVAITGYDGAAVESGDVNWREDVVHPDDRERVADEIADQLGDGDRFRVRYRIRTTEDETRWVTERGCVVAGSSDDRGVLEGVVSDVTEHERARRRLVEQKHQFESLVEAADEYAIFMLDPDGRVVTWNSGAAAIKGYDREAITGEHFSRFYTEEDRESRVPERNLAKAAREGSVQDEGWRVRADGSRFWAHVTITAIRDEDGDLEGFAKVTRDMTERRERERRLARKLDDLERELDDVFDRIDDAFFGLDEAWRFTYLNERAEELLHTEGRDLVGKCIWEAFPETVDSAFEERYERAMETQETVTFEEYYAPLERWFEVTAYPSETGLSVYFRDVSERVARERELELYETIVETADDGVYVLDEDFHFTMVNDAYVELTGYDREELVGEHCSLVVDDAVSQESAERLQAIAAGDEDGGSIEADIHRADGTTLRAESNFTALSSAGGERPWKIGVVRDVSERVARERELELYETIVETVDDGVYVMDERGHFTMVNDAYVELTGYDSAELIGEPGSKVVGEETAAAARELHRELATGDAETARLEADLVTADGDELVVEATFAILEDGDGVHQRVGVVRDVSERIEYERELENRFRQQQIVTDLGQRALEERDIDELMTEVVEQVAETLGTDYCKVLDLDRDAEELLLRQGVGWDDGVVGEATVSAVEADSQAAYTLETEGPVSVTDLETETRFSGPDLLTSHDVRSGISVVIGSRDDPWGILGTHDTERRDFSDHDVNFVLSVANVLASAVDRHEDEQALRRQREQLAAINNINEVVRGITDAVIEQSTREEIESTVCEHLADADSYSFAWIGETDAAAETVDLRTEAGVEGYLDGIEITLDPDDPLGDGPTARALRTGRIQTVQNSETDARHEPWRAHLERHGVHSSAAIPIVHEETVYGVLNVYADRPWAFADRERAVIAQLGEIVGHAIAATDRKQALMSDELVELEFWIEDVFSALDAPTATDGLITLDRAVPIGDGEFLVYGTASADAVETLTGLVETLPHWGSVTVHSEGDPTGFELRLTDPPVLSVIASLGGYVEEAVLEDGDYRMRIHLAPSVDARRVIDAVQETYPTAEMLRRRQISRSRDDPRRGQRLLEEELTDRQRAALEAAYHSGFFEWPRDASGKAVAESLDVSPPTFHQHIRKAQKKVFDSLFASAT